MNKPQCFGVGTVEKAEIVTPENGKPFLAVRVRMTERDIGNGKRFAQKVDVRQYWQHLETHSRISKGQLASFRGEADAFAEEHKGKTYANLRVVGTIEPENPIDLEERAERYPAQPKPRDNPQPQRFVPQPKPADQPEAETQDDIPF